MARVLILDDDAGIRDLLEEVLREEGHSLWSQPPADAVAPLVTRHRPDLVLLGCRSPEAGDPWALLEAVRADPATAQLPVISCLADPRRVAARAAWLAEQPTWFLPQPFDLDELLTAVQAALAQRRRG